jgi:hypothetical protein
MPTHRAPTSGGLVATPGDVLFSHFALPAPDLILQGFRRTQGEKRDPVVSFSALQRLLEFLEYVVLTERLIIPVPRFTVQTERMLKARSLAIHFEVFRMRGDLAFTDGDIADRLEDAGVLCHAHIGVGAATADELIERLLPSSAALQGEFVQYIESPVAHRNFDKQAIAKAQLAVHLGAPLHVAEAAGLARTPFVLSSFEIESLSAYERETARFRKSVGMVLLDRVSAAVRKELSNLTDLGLLATFPETPIASMILHDSSSPQEMLEVALQLRTQLAPFRRDLNALEHSLANEDQPLKARLKQLRELERVSKLLSPGVRIVVAWPM